MNSKVCGSGHRRQTGILRDVRTEGDLRVKKVETHQVFEETSVSLYREDLDELLGVLAKYCSKVKISDHQYEYDSFEELERERGKSLRGLKLTGQFPFLSLSLGPKFYLFTGPPFAGEPSCEIPYLSLKEMLSKRISKVGKVFNWWWWLALLWFWVSLTGTPIATKLQIPLTLQISVLCLLVVGLGISVAVARGWFFNISLSKRHATESFWSRNRDKMILAIISAVFGAIVSHVWPLFFKSGQ